MPTIFLDEAGYTGRNLLDPAQPIFTLASLCCPEDVCKDLKQKFFNKVKAAELKYTSLARRHSGQQMVLAFLRELAEHPDRVKLAIADKEYVLVTKMVDVIVEPAMHMDGIDAYDRGFNIILSNIFYSLIPSLGGRDFFRKLLSHFQQMMQSREPDDYRKFFGLIVDREFEDSTLEEFLWFLRAGHYKLNVDILDAPTHTLDFAMSLTLSLMTLWREDIKDGSGITLIHDASSAMARDKDIWDSLVNPDITPQIVGYDVRKVQFPISVTETHAEDSKNWVGLQLADIVAGATAASARWLAEGSDVKDKYLYEVNELINSESYNKFVIWPSNKFTPEELGTVGENATPLVDAVTKILMERLERE